MKPLLALAVVLVLGGCGADPEPQAVSQEQACAQAEDVTDTYREALGDAGSAEDAEAVIDGAISGLRGIDAAPPVATRVGDLADALSSLRDAVRAGTPPAQLQPKAAAIGAATTALAQVCGRAGQ